jgi:hypothetical protein
MAFHRFHLLIKRTQVDPAHQVPNRSRRVLLRDQAFDIEVQHPELITIQGADSRLGRGGRRRDPENGLGMEFH